jgi:hypothetical protein
MSCGIMKSFQDCRKAKMPTVALIGASSGSTIFRKVCQVVQPSIRALSSNSTGMDRMKAEKSSTLKASENMMCRSATPRVSASSHAGSLRQGMFF